MELFDELAQIPAVLMDVARYYATEEGRGRLALPVPTRPLLVGMGASYQAAWIGALMLRRAGIPAQYEEATDVLNYQPHLSDHYAPLIYLSQSGSSGEIQPILERYPHKDQRIAVTNQPDSLLGQQAGTVLPILAGEEAYIAGKTYLNSLAVLWLVAQSWSGHALSGATESLRQIAARADELLRRREEAVGRLQRIFDACQSVAFLGHGPHAATARQAAMNLSEWPKLAVHYYGVGAYRHGFIEAVDASAGMIFFTPPGPTRASTLALAQEVQRYGAQVLRIENGQVLALDEPTGAAAPPDEMLSPLLDMLPIYWFAEAAARRRLPQPGFRYITKVVSNL